MKIKTPLILYKQTVITKGKTLISLDEMLIINLEIIFTHGVNLNDKKNF